MKQLLISLFICFFSWGISQESGAKITYGVTFSPEKTDNDELANIFANAAKKLNQTTFTLLCTNQEATFFPNKNLDNEADNGSYVALSIIEAKGRYYTNFKEQIILEEREAYGDKFVIRYGLDKDWILSKERKEIGGMICYKATSIYSLDNGVKKISIPVIAWYAPEVNLPYGPKQYSGLPGLIVQLQEKNIIFTATELSLGPLSNQNKDKIVRPVRSKKALTRKEFEEVGIQIAKKRFGG